MTSGPLVSIIMSAYNAEETLVEALESIYRQTHTNWELIVCDDASGDGTYKILSSAAAASDGMRVVVLRNRTNRRLAYSLNRCLEIASGEYVARMDADDVSAPNRIERQLAYLSEHPGVDLVGSWMRRFDASGLGDLVQPASDAPDRWTMATSQTVPFCHATILARRSVFAEVGGYTVAWRTARAEDLDLWFKFFAAGLVGRNLPEPLYLVREDRAAIRRRTPTVRLQVVATRYVGNRVLNYPLRAYRQLVIELLKALVPYRLVDWHRDWSRKRSEQGR